MSRNTIRPLLLLLVFVLLVFYRCRKEEPLNQLVQVKGKITVEDARSFFERQVLPNSPNTALARRSGKRITIEEVLSNKVNHRLYKHPIWDSPYYKVAGDDTALAIPIKFELRGVQLTGASEGINIDDLNYLLFLKDGNGNLSYEWITLYPDSAWVYGPRNFYIGKVKVSDWDGNMLRGYVYDSKGREQILTAGNSIALNKENTGSGNVGAPTLSYYYDVWGDCWEDLSQEGTMDGLILYREQVNCPRPRVVEPDPFREITPEEMRRLRPPEDNCRFYSDPSDAKPGLPPACMPLFKTEKTDEILPPGVRKLQDEPYRLSIYREFISGAKEDRLLKDITPWQVKDPTTGEMVDNKEAYNCHYHSFGLKYASSVDATHPKWVINISLPETDWEMVLDEVSVDDRVLYMDFRKGQYGLTHSGIVTEVDDKGRATKISSKMGTYEVIEHHPRDVPNEFGPIAPSITHDGKVYASRVYVRRKY